MTRQHVRKLLLILSLLLFPVTLYCFSPALIINGALNGIINGSFIVFALLFVLSIPFGRLFCAYFCPAGGLQECAFAVNDKKPRQGWRNAVKFVIWAVWLALVVFCCLRGGKTVAVDFFFETDHGVSLSSFQSYVIYYGIVCLILLPALLGGKRAFCHYFCWMAPFMILGTKLRRALRLPGLHVKADKARCVSCGSCDRACPMGVDVMAAVARGAVDSPECIQCGACIDRCPQHVLSYGMARGKEKSHAK